MTGGGNARNGRRREILKELGLTPLWHVRPARPASMPQPPELSQERQAAPLPPPPPAASAMKAESGEQVCSDSSVGAVSALEDRRSKILQMGWEELETSVAGCIACRLCHSRTRTVFGVGDQNADWLYIGEGPGAQEDATGEPFVGQAGKLLDNMLTAIDLKRGRNVFITNIVKCRPPGNREPRPDEAQCCEPYLARQIELIRPKLIIALGKTAVQNLLHTDASLGSLRGRLHRHSGIPVIVTYHPAYLLRTLPAKAKAWEDLCFARSTMEALRTSG
ncbi:uracil-DNA glycosylase [Nitrosovibrio sp. Nv4]|uniref:uracil-DNA glycosylase n=1 Tax=Nitrosovibrio sp. Nv4 TaxID=1945880 RepID=UPI000BD99A35|nr:uracil-DNA glycosylase [Nitrosovibrio sp. Nv4]SOD42517.1 DNA polymerase [Nitrosovibrio sp. Nv4]